MSVPLQITIDKILESVCGPIIIDCVGLSLYENIVINNLISQDMSEVYQINIVNGNIVCKNIRSDEQISVHELLDRRNNVEPEYFFIVAQNYEKISSIEKIFRDRSSLGRLKEMINLKKQIEEYYFDSIKSLSYYSEVGLNPFREFLESHCITFPRDQIKPLHEIIYCLRYYASLWKITPSKCLDEVYFLTFQSIQETWQNIGTLFGVDFSNMPSFSKVKEEKYYGEFIQNIENFFGYKNAFIRTLNKHKKLLIDVSTVKFSFSNKIKFNIDKINKFDIPKEEKKVTREFFMSEYLRMTCEDKIEGDLKKCINEIEDLTHKVSFTVKDVSNQSIEGAYIEITKNKTLKKGLTNNVGILELFKLVNGMYFLNIWKTDYKSYSNNFTINDNDIVQSIILQEISKPIKLVKDKSSKLEGEQESDSEAEDDTVDSIDDVIFEMNRSSRNKLILRNKSMQIDIPSDFLLLPQGNIKINSISYNGVNIKLNSQDLHNDLPSRILNRYDKNIFRPNEIFNTIIIDFENDSYAFRIKDISSYFSEFELTELDELIEIRSQVIKSEQDNKILISRYWKAYERVIITSNRNLAEKLVWLDISKIKRGTLPKSFDIIIHNEETKYIDSSSGDIYLKLNNDDVETILDREIEDVRIALMHEIHPCKQYAISKKLKYLTGIPIVISDQEGELYNYRGSNPSLFIKSSSDLPEEEADVYWNLVDDVQHKTIGAESGTLKTIPKRIKDIIMNSYINQRKLKFSSNEFRLISYGSGRGIHEKDIVESILNNPIKDIVQSTVFMIDKADQKLGSRFNFTGSITNKINYMLLGEDFKNALEKLPKKILPFDIGLFSRLLHLSSKYKIIPIDVSDETTESAQEKQWASASIGKRTGPDLVYPHKPFHKFYAASFRISEPSSNVKKFCLPSRDLGDLKPIFHKLLSQALLISWAAIIVDLDYNADEIYKLMTRAMERGWLHGLDCDFDIYSYEKEPPELILHSSVRSKTNKYERYYPGEYVNRPTNSSFYYTFLINNDSPIENEE